MNGPAGALLLLAALALPLPAAQPGALPVGQASERLPQDPPEPMERACLDSLGAGRFASAAALVLPGAGAARLDWFRSQLLAAASGLAAADPLVTRLREPGALGLPSVTLLPSHDRSSLSVLEAAGAWALQPDTPEARERLSGWLDLADAHPFELPVEYVVPGFRAAPPETARAMLWLLSGRLETVEAAGRPTAAARGCVEAARVSGPGLSPDWLELALAPPAFAEPVARARTELAAGRREAALRLYRAACAGACRVRDGAPAVRELLREALAAFPGDLELARFESALLCRVGRAMPRRALWWALAAAASMERAEGAETLKRLRAARDLLEAMPPGPGDLTPVLWASERMLIRESGSYPALSDPAGTLLSLPPNRWLAPVLPDEAFAYALADRWLARARELGDPRLLLRIELDQGRPGEGNLVLVESLLEKHRFLEALETLAGLPLLASDDGLRDRVAVDSALARRGEPPPVLRPSAATTAAAKARALLDAAVLDLDDGQPRAALDRLALLAEEFARDPAALRLQAVAALEAGEPAAAREAAGRVLRELPEDPLALAVRGALALREGRAAEALGDFERATANQPCALLAALGRARSLAALGRAAESALWFGSAFDLTPWNAEATSALKRVPSEAPLAPAREGLVRRVLAMDLSAHRWREALASLERVATLLPPPAGPGPEACTSEAERTLRLLAHGRYSLLREALRTLLSARRPGRQGPADSAADNALPAPLLGLKRDPDRAWTTPDSPFGGAWSPAARRLFRLVYVGILLAAWVRLHLFLLAVFLPGVAFFKWLHRRPQQLRPDTGG
ncbi:MAG: hypothetical protein HY303_21035 [Candidatus Wallbacteria bacterium]|nr:hypothetical protein [Candidatus Wallbacteria bacterium]